MTNTPTADIWATVAQIKSLAQAGSELVRLTVNTTAAAEALPEIRARLADQGVEVPLVGDFHFNGHELLRGAPEAAQALDKYRINPGTVGPGRYQDQNFRTMIEIAVAYGRPVRIGVNWGSLDQGLLAKLMDNNANLAEPKSSHQVLLEAIIESAVHSAELAEQYGMPHDKIILSAKVSHAPDLWTVYHRLAGRVDYPLHLGLTEAGMGAKGLVASTAGLIPLLAKGIGDTIRVSLTPEPGTPRTREVEAAQLILQAAGLRRFAPSISSCPGCGRTSSSLYQELAERIQKDLTSNMHVWRERYPGVEQLNIAVMGCVVNGPGESKYADIGISLPGAGEAPRVPVYIDGKLTHTLQGKRIPEAFMELVEAYVKRRFPSGNTPVH